MVKKEQIQKILSRLSPSQQAIMEDYARLKVENVNYIRAFKEANEAYESIFKPFLVIVHASEGQELRIHKSQFLRFKHEYRIDSRFDGETNEMVFSLKTLKDD
jgi:hypothetical protein